MVARELLDMIKQETVKTLTCFNGEVVLVDPDDWEWADQEKWLWSDRSGAYRNEPDAIRDYNVYLHREIMGITLQREERVERSERRGPLAEELCVGFLDGNRANCCKANLFLFRSGCGEGNKLRAAARARAGVFGGGTHNSPIGDEYETLGCVCGALTRVPVDIRKTPDHKCRCSKCHRRLSKESM